MSKKESILSTNRHRFPIIEISILVIIALGLRFIFLNSEIPLSLDALSYFSFSYETMVQGHIPEIVPFTNLGWPMFVTFFFTIFSFDSAIEYMNLQKIISVALSSLTIIPVYILCRKFTENKYALFASALFIFDPRIIQNSILGITDAFYLLMMTSVFVLFFNNQKKYVYLAFALSALTTLIRAEGVFVFIAISILFFIKFKNEKKNILKYLIGFAIFILILSPILSERIDLFQNEFMPQFVTESEITIEDQQSITPNPITGFENFVKFLGWSMIPVYVVFLIPGFILMIKKWKRENFEIIIPIIIMSIPILYAYSIQAQDTRYLFVLFPFFSIIATFSLEKLGDKLSEIRKILPIILGIVIISSIVFLYEKTDYEHEKESYLISKYLVENAYGINNIYPESQFIRSVEVIEDFPNIPFKDDTGEYTHKMKIFKSQEKNLTGFIESEKENGLTHIIIKNKNFNGINYEIDNNKENYEFLEKIFNSNERGWENNFEIFKINYEKFQMIQEKQDE